MTTRTTGLLTILALTVACATDRPVRADAVPEWLAVIIDQLEHPPVTNPPEVIARYTFHGQVVYYVGPRCCDIPSTLYNAEGTVLCSPDGGFSGSGDGRCPDFVAGRSDEKILWRPRSGA